MVTYLFYSNIPGQGQESLKIQMAVALFQAGRWFSTSSLRPKILIPLTVFEPPADYH
jgi:hypothetical protein